MLRGELIDLAQTWNDQVFRDAPGEHRKWIDEYRDAQEKGLELDNIRGAKQQSMSPGADMLSVRDCNFGCVFTYVEAGCIFQLVECRVCSPNPFYLYHRFAALSAMFSAHVDSNPLMTKTFESENLALSLYSILKVCYVALW